MSSRFHFFFTEALRSLSTNLATSVAATLSMLVALLVVGVCGLFLSLIYGEAQQAAREAGTVNVFLKETVSEDEVNAIQQRLEQMPEVESVTYISKDDALRRAKRMFKDNPDLLKNLPSNPFPASVEATLKDPKMAETVAKRMQGDAGVHGDVEFGGSEAKQVVRGATVVSTVLLVLGAFLVVAATMLVANTIRLSIFARRREIEVMKLVGASNSFVRLPFMIEGFLCGLVAAIGAISLIGIGKLMLSNILSGKSFGDASAVSVPMVFLALLGMGILLGGFGSGLTIRKYLKV